MDLKKIGIVLIGCFIVVGVSLCRAQDDYPKKQIEVIVPYAPGGAVDLIMRIAGEKMESILGQPVVVVNKPGGAAAIGTTYVAKAKPDGYSLLLSTPGIVLRPLYDPSVPYRRSDFKPVGVFTRANYVIAVVNSLPVKNLAELVAHCKKNPNSLSFAFSGIGGSTHLSMELLKLQTQMTDIELKGVPYPGESQALLALLGNHVQVGIFTVSSTIPYAEKNEIRPLAIPSDTRDTFLGEVPTTVEQGFPEIVCFSYFVLLVPAKTPDHVVAKLGLAMEKALQDKSVSDKLTKLYLPPRYMNARDTKLFQDDQNEKWSKLVEKVGIKKR